MTSLLARGTRDIYGTNGLAHNNLIQSFIRMAELYDLQPMYTPIFEFAETFNSVGKTSDIVSKEMYVFTDRSGEQLALRPEGTAPVMRAIASNGLSQTMPFKCYYHGPMFRYERPQSGRYRQFHQVGIELLGTDSILADIEAIKMAHDWLLSLNLREPLKLNLNSLGDDESRDKYRKLLTEFLQDFKDQLSQDSKTRLVKNPLRILDSKDKGDRTLLAQAPNYLDSLNDYSKEIFAKICESLSNCGVNFIVNSQLVRGLDYYKHTVFEFLTHQGLAVLAGGRYSGISQRFNIKDDILGVGWAAGSDRLVEIMADQSISRKIGFVVFGDEARKYGLNFVTKLRASGFVINMAYETSFKKAMKKMHNAGVSHTLLLGDDEITNQRITIKDMTKGEQSDIDLDLQKVISYFKTNRL